jgi:Flp pilus assembly protein TadD
MKRYMRFTILTLLLTLGAARVYAQFDDSKPDSNSEDSDNTSKKKSDEATKDLPQAKPDKDDMSFDNDGDKSAEPKGLEVTKAEKDDLIAAFKKKSEPALIKAVSAILSKDPTNLDALNALALHFFEDKKFGMAKIILKRAMKDHSKEPALENNLGIIYLAEGETLLAVEQFRKSLAARNDYRIGATNLSSIYLEYLDYKRSIAPLEDSYKAVHSDVSRGDSNAIDIANNYGVALIGIGDFAKAEEVFGEIVATNTRNAVPYLNYAILLVEVQKKKKDAIRVISKLKFMTDDRDILRRVDELERKME